MRERYFYSAYGIRLVNWDNLLLQLREPKGEITLASSQYDDNVPIEKEQPIVDFSSKG